ncbi:cytochrome P450 [Saccharomonospora saliphila]|uniref:cytochrome P450 n=1 Tax=Saccharomonospora saliphila TaxID=369829 RepID=UPI0003796BC8|nr:cytochrome P450 [Saccharomonospora saliphila]
MPTPLSFNPLEPPDRDDPFAFFTRSRTHQPLVFIDAMQAWLVTRYDDCVRVLSDPDTYSSRGTLPPPDTVNPPEVLDILAQAPEPGVTMLTVDPPQHHHYRAIGQRLFGRRRLQQALATSRDQAHVLLDEITTTRRVELNHQFTRPYVRRVLARLLDISDNDAAQLCRWNDDFLLLMSPYATTTQRLDAAHGTVAYHHYVHDLVTSRARHPGDDMVSTLVADGFDTVPLADARMLVRAVFAGGFHTTVNAINSAVLAMLDAGNGYWRHTGGDASEAGVMFEEALRRDAPHRGLVRLVTRQTELAGVELHPGERVLPMLGSANRDATQFHTPDAFCPHRRDVRDHLGFGHGVHKCIGAPLARLQGREALHALARRLPHATVAPGWEREYEPEYFFWGPRTLPLVW